MSVMGVAYGVGFGSFANFGSRHLWCILATIPITSTGINPRSKPRGDRHLQVYNHGEAWDDQVCVYWFTLRRGQIHQLRLKQGF